MRFQSIMLVKMELKYQDYSHRNHHALNDQDVTTFTSDDGDHEDDTISHEIESFDMIGKSAPKSEDSTLKKLSWLRSQIIGGSAEFDTPFGRRSLTYADHTASGRSLRCIENYISTNILPFYGNTHTSDSYVGQQTTKMMHEATNYVKKCLGGGEEDVIIFCGSGSTAAVKRLQETMGIAVPSMLRERVLKCLRDEERWVVFVGPYEHHSNILPWRQSLAEVVEIGFDHRGQIDVEVFREKLTFYGGEGRPILGSFSACSNVTGICTDTRLIARLLHRFGGFACFDFAASGPHAKIDMRTGKMDGYDAIFLSTHKFVGGPGTPGILVMSNKLYLLGSLPPSTAGGGTVHYVNGFDPKDTIYLDNIEEREDAGSPQIIQKIRAALAFWIKEYIGSKAIDGVEKSYIKRALQRLLPNPKLMILGKTDCDVERQSAIMSFLIYPSGMESNTDEARRRGKPLHGAFVAKLLNDLFGIQARGGCACAGPYAHTLLNIDYHRSLAFRSLIQKGYVGIKPGWTRVSFSYYTSEQEFQSILAAIEFIAIYGHKFLCCYSFNWNTGAWTFDKNTKALSYQHGSSLVRMWKQDLHTNYLETAKRIVDLLPRFSPQKQIPKEIDVDLVTFRV